MKNIDLEARRIISEHTNATIQCTEHKFTTNQELYEYMVDGCAYILTEGLFDGTYTPKEYNDIRNKLATLLWSTFEKHIHDEQ